MFFQKRLMIYPNPSSGIFYVDTKVMGNIRKGSVFQMDGRLIPGSITHHNGYITVDLSSNKRGIYILRLEDGKHSFAEKLVLN